MNVLLDANVISIALRRNKPDPAIQSHLQSLLLSKSAFIIGAVRQETLSGFASEEQYHRLHTHIRAIPLLPVLPEDYDLAAICGRSALMLVSARLRQMAGTK